MPDGLKIKIDDAVFKRNLELYLKHTSKTMVDAVNFKLYDGAREAIRKTPKASKSEILSTLNARSSKYPDRTVAEMLTVRKMWAEGVKTFDLEEEVQKFIGKRTSGIGFAKSGWLPGLKKLLRYVQKSFVSVSGVNREGFGGAEPARETLGSIKGSVFNDVAGTGNFSFVEQIKEQGGDAAIAKINSDIVTYLSKKLDKPASEFNKG